MSKIAVIGAGGKMGYRVTTKLHGAGHDVHAVEISDAGRKRLDEAGVPVIDEVDALKSADVVVLAVPDTVIGEVARKVAPKMPAGAMILVMDAAAPFAGALPDNRPDLTYFLAHPCHPPLFNELTNMEQRQDHMGGVAPQAIVCALMQGPEEHYAIGEDVAKAMWAPIIRSHRVTTEQMAILEPGLSEMIALPFVDIMKKAVDVCAEQGVPREAAFDFLMGHLHVEIAMWFGFKPRQPSDAAERLLRWATPYVANENWQDALKPELIMAACKLIAEEQAAAAAERIA